MSSLFSQVRGLSSAGSQKSVSNRRPSREDRYILEQYPARNGTTHKYLLTDIILDGVVFKKDSTSLTRSCNNLVSRNQFMLQTLENLNTLVSNIKYQLLLSGAAIRDQGMLYDATFPRPLREWIEANVNRDQRSNLEDSEMEEDVIKSLIGQLILINSIRDDMN